MMRHRTAHALTRRLQADGLPDALNRCFHESRAPLARSYHFVNAYSLYLASGDEEYANTLHSGILFPDSRPLAKLMATVNDASMQQVRGPQFFDDGVRLAAKNGLRQYFMGSSPETLSALTSRLRSLVPNIEIAGSDSPPYGGSDAQELARRDAIIVAAHPDIVWLGLGTPQQDPEAARLSRTLGLPVFAVGAAFDFSAGTVPSAPVWMQRLYLEWLYRLTKEPRRLWRRYLFGNTFLVRHALYLLLKQTKGICFRRSAAAQQGAIDAPND